MAIKYINMFQSKALQNLPKLTNHLATLLFTLHPVTKNVRNRIPDKKNNEGKKLFFIFMIFGATNFTQKFVVTGSKFGSTFLYINGINLPKI
jgi:hypothetical protein